MFLCGEKPDIASLVRSDVRSIVVVEASSTTTMDRTSRPPAQENEPHPLMPGIDLAWLSEVWFAFLQKSLHAFLGIRQLRGRGHDLLGVHVGLWLRHLDLRVVGLFAYAF